MRTSVRELLHAAVLGGVVCGVLGASALLAAGVQAAGPVHPSPEAVQPLSPGESVPSAELHDVRGTPVPLSRLVEKSGALLVFYRGGW